MPLGLHPFTDMNDNISQEPVSMKTALPFSPSGIVFPFFLLCLFLLTPPPAHAASVDHLNLEQIAIMQRLQDTLHAFDKWQLTQFKKSAWEDLSDALYDYLLEASAKKDHDAIVAELTERRFRPVLIRMDSKLREVLCFGPDKGKCPDAGPPTPMNETGKTVVIQLEQVVEAAYVLQAIGPELVRNVEAWKVQGNWLGWNKTSREKIQADVVKALHHYRRAMQAAAAAEALVQADDWLLQLLGVNKAALEPLLAQASLAHDKSVVGDLLVSKQTLDERLNQHARAAHDVREKLIAEHERVRQWFIGRKDKLGILYRNAQALAQQGFRFPLIRPQKPSDPMVLLLVQKTPAPAGSPWDGTFIGRLTLAMAIDGQTTLKATLSPGTVAKAITSDQAYSELDLGITLEGLQLDVGKKSFDFGRAFRNDVRLPDAAEIKTLLGNLGLSGLLSTSLPIRPVRLTYSNLFDPKKIALSIVGEVHLPFDGESIQVLLPLVRPTAGDSSQVVGREEIVAELRDQLAREVNVRLERIGRRVALSPGDPAAVALEEIRIVTNGDGKAKPVGNEPLTMEGVIRITQPALRWPVAVRIDDGHLQPVSIRVPGAVVNQLRQTLLAEPSVRDLAQELGLASEALERNLNLSEVILDPGRGTLSGALNFTFDGHPLSDRFTVQAQPFKLSFGGNSIRQYLKDLAKDKLDDLAGEVAEQMHNRAAEAVEEIRKRLDDQKIQVFGLSFTVTALPPKDGTFPVTLSATGFKDGRTVTLSGVTLLQPRFDNGQLQLSKENIRFENAKLVGVKLNELVSQQTGLDESLLTLSQERWQPQGVAFDLYLKLEALGEDLPVGTLALGLGGIDAQPYKDLDRLLQTQLDRLLAKGGFEIGDVGPVTKLKAEMCTPGERGTCTYIDITKRRMELWLSGEISLKEVAKDLMLPFRARLLNQSGPAFEVKINTDALKSGVLSQMLASALPVDLSGVQIKGVRTSPPYGLDLTANINLEFIELVLGQFSITQQGLILPEKVGVRMANPPLKFGYFTIVHPGISVLLPQKKDDRVVGIEILGDLTFEPGMENILKIDSSIEANVRDQQFSLEGRLIALKFLPIFQTDGKLSLKQSQAEVTSQVIGPLKKLIDSRQQSVLDAGAQEIRSRGKLSVLGFTLSETDLRFEGRYSRFSAIAETSIPLISTTMSVVAAPDLRKASAKAGFSLDLGSWHISRADLKANIARAQLDLTVLGLHATVITPSVTTLTPGLILDIVASLFKFDLASLFEAIKRGDIVVNLLDPGGNPTSGSIGEGDPLPPPEGGSDGAEGQPQEVPPGEPAGEPEPSIEGPGLPPPEQESNTAVGGQPSPQSPGLPEPPPATDSVKQGQKIPDLPSPAEAGALLEAAQNNEMVLFPAKKNEIGCGDTFEPLSDPPDHYRRVTRCSDGRRYEDPWVLSQAVHDLENYACRKNVLKKPCMVVLKRVAFPDPRPKEKTEAPWWSWLWYRQNYVRADVMMDLESTALWIARLGKNGEAKPMETSLNAFDLGAKDAGLIKAFQEGRIRLRTGDEEILGQLVQSTLYPEIFGSINGFSAFPFDPGDGPQRVYAYTRKAGTAPDVPKEPTESFYLVTRDGQSLEVRPESPLFKSLNGNVENALRNRLLQALMQQRNIDLVWAGGELSEIYLFQFGPRPGKPADGTILVSVTPERQSAEAVLRSGPLGNQRGYLMPTQEPVDKFWETVAQHLLNPVGNQPVTDLYYQDKGYTSEQSRSMILGQNLASTVPNQWSVGALIQPRFPGEQPMTAAPAADWEKGQVNDEYRVSGAELATKLQWQQANVCPEATEITATSLVDPTQRRRFMQALTTDEENWRQNLGFCSHPLMLLSPNR